MEQLVLILDNLRSSANVGSILRTADSAGIKRVICCGSTPYPRLKNDLRDPVVINRNMKEIAKTALGAEQTVTIEHYDDTTAAIDAMRREKRDIYLLEQHPNSHNIMNFSPTLPAAIVVGNEVDGVQNELFKLADAVLEIPQRGAKESLNVSVATGIAVYQLLRHSLT